MDKKLGVNVIDGGTIDERINMMKEFFELRPDQTFQDLEINEEDEENN